MKTTQEIIADGLALHNVSVLLIGGMALPAFDVVRQTVDVDCLIASNDLDALNDVLTDAGYEEVVRTTSFARYSSPSVYHYDVDVLFVDKDTFDKIFQESKHLSTGGASFQVPCVAHMIMLKLHSMKNSSKRELKDLGDIVELLRNNCSAVSIEELKGMCKKFGPKGVYEKVKEAL